MVIGSTGQLVAAPFQAALVLAWFCLGHVLVSADVAETGITLEWEKIFVNIENGPTFSLMVNPDDTVRSLKEDINELEGIPFDKMKLAVGNRPLDSNARLNEYIRSNTTVTLIIAEDLGHHTTRITVKTRDEQELSVDTQLDNSVYNLKDKIMQLTGIVQVEQRLLLEGKELKNNRKMLTYDIHDGTKLNLGTSLEDCRQAVTIIIKSLSGTSFEVAANLADTVIGLKKKIWTKAGVPTGVQRLYANGRVITGEDHLCDLGLEAGSTVYMTLYSSRITNPNQVAMLQEPLAAWRPVVDDYRAPIFHEAEDVGEPVQCSGRCCRRATLFKDARNWIARDGPRPNWDPDLFDPVAYLSPNPDDECWVGHHRTLEMLSRSGASELDRLEAVIFGARIKLSSAVRPYRVAPARLTSLCHHPNRHPGITLGGGSTVVSLVEQPMRLGADVNNWAPDAFNDADLMRLFEVSERVRRVLTRGKGILSIASQKRINNAILFSYLEALAGYPLSLVCNQASSEDGECGICRDELSAEPAIKLACEHAFHSDCILPWAANMIQAREIPSCPYCRQKFMFPYEILGKAELETPELQNNQDE